MYVKGDLDEIGKGFHEEHFISCPLCFKAICYARLAREHTGDKLDNLLEVFQEGRSYTLDYIKWAVRRIVKKLEG